MMQSPFFKKIKKKKYIYKTEINSIFNPIVKMPIINFFNPYLKKTLIDMEIYSNIDDNSNNKIVISHTDAMYQISQLMPEKYNLSKVKIQNVVLHTDIENYNLDESVLNNDEMKLYEKNINLIHNKLITTENTFEIFLYIYMDAPKMKTDHLSKIINLNIKKNNKRPNISECGIKNFIINNKINKTNIVNEYNLLLEKYNLLHRINNQNNSRPEACFCLNKICFLFEKYILSLKYYLQLLKLKPYVIRYNKLFSLDNTEYIKLNDNDSIEIKHMDTFLDCKVSTNENENKYSDKILLKKTPKRNDIIFI